MSAHSDSESIFSRLRTGLGRHLALVLIIKVLALAGLWHTFVKPYRVRIDSSQMSHRLAGPSVQTIREKSHD